MKDFGIQTILQKHNHSQHDDTFNYHKKRGRKKINKRPSLPDEHEEFGETVPHRLAAPLPARKTKKMKKAQKILKRGEVKTSDEDAEDGKSKKSKNFPVKSRSIKHGKQEESTDDGELTSDQEGEQLKEILPVPTVIRSKSNPNIIVDTLTHITPSGDNSKKKKRYFEFQEKKRSAYQIALEEEKNAIQNCNSGRKTRQSSK
jgi:hypothetical protein